MQLRVAILFRLQRRRYCVSAARLVARRIFRGEAWLTSIDFGVFFRWHTVSEKRNYKSPSSRTVCPHRTKPAVRMKHAQLSE
jgi:hypothetical protein